MSLGTNRYGVVLSFDHLRSLLVAAGLATLFTLVITCALQLTHCLSLAITTLDTLFQPTTAMTFTAACCFFTAGILIAVSKARMVLLVVGDLVIVHLVATRTLRKFWLCIIAYLLNATFLHLVFITVLIHLISSLLLQLLLLLLVQSSVFFGPCPYFRFDMSVV